MINNIVLIIFLILIIIQICQMLKPKIIEGNSNNDDSSTYQDNGLSDDPLYLATINASNIQYLKDNLDDITNLTNIVMDLSGRILQNTNAITGISTAQANANTSDNDTSALDLDNASPDGPDTDDES